MPKSGLIAIAGRPNAGKSTLMNRVVGARLSIVTPKAQTTRDRVLGILTEKQGQIVFIDTPGIHRAKEGGINAYMMGQVREALEGVDAVWYIVDPSSKAQPERAVLDLLAQSLPKGEDRPAIFLILNKSDLKNGVFAPESVAKFIEVLKAEAAERGLTFEGDAHRISARTGKGVPELKSASWQKIGEGELLYPDEEQLSDRPTRFFVGEMIREQLLLKLGEELPYSCAVEIEKFDELSKPPRIEAVIHVERDSQKGMVIGKSGAKIKEIGQSARKEIEEFIGGQVFLGLRVKVLKEWSRDSENLKRLGYVLPDQGGRKKSGSGKRKASA